MFHMERRLGRFIVSKSLMRDKRVDWYKFFSLLEFVPIKAEYLLEQDGMVYLGYSPKFNFCEEVKYVPTYKIIPELRDGEDGTYLDDIRVEMVEL